MTKLATDEYTNYIEYPFFSIFPIFYFNFSSSDMLIEYYKNQ